jgi:succinyl-CoA synthetase alpha subunit
MSILIDEHTRVIVQGITGRDGSFHAARMLDYGTNVVAGVTPGKGGLEISGVPVCNSVKEAVKQTSADCSIVFVPARFAADAVREAIAGGVRLIICITEGIPALDSLGLYYESRRHSVRLIGPNCPGVISPGKSKVGILPHSIHLPGTVGVVSRSGTLTYEIVQGLSLAGLGQSTCVGIGGDPVVGTGFVEILELFENDPGTSAVVMVGEIGGGEEEKAAEFIALKMTKKVVAYICGRTAPPEKTMGHAGAIISGGTGTVEAKTRALQNAGVTVVQRPDEVAQALTALQ